MSWRSWSNAFDCKSNEETHRRFKSYRHHILKFRASEKSLGHNLKQIYGISEARASELALKIGVRLETTVSKISSVKLNSLYEILGKYNNLNSSYAIHKNLTRFVRGNIKRLVKINSYRGRRHKFRLPTRGQRTRSNARSARSSYV